MGLLSATGAVASDFGFGQQSSVTSSLLTTVGAALGINGPSNLNVLTQQLGTLAIQTSKSNSTFHPNEGTTSTPFSIGGFLLAGMELPQQLDSVGGDQVLAVHDFPGGIRTIQSLGAFPPKEIRWSGIFIGTNAWDRAYQFDRLRITGKEIDLTFAKWNFKGKIESFHVLVHHEWYCTYNLVFVPSKDQSSPPVKPTIDTSVSTLDQAFNGLSNNLPTSAFGDVIPTQLAQPLYQLLSVGRSGLLAADNILSVVAPSTINDVNTYASSALSIGNSILQSNSIGNLSLSLVASVAHVLSYASVIKNIYTQPSPISETLTLINPNLFSLAAQYYGDASQWLPIAQANNLTDPQPSGEYTLTIPTKSALPPKTQTTLGSGG